MNDEYEWGWFAQNLLSKIKHLALVRTVGYLTEVAWVWNQHTVPFAGLTGIACIGLFSSVGKISRLAELKSTKNKELLYFISSRVELISGGFSFFNFCHYQPVGLLIKKFKS